MVGLVNRKHNIRSSSNIFYNEMVTISLKILRISIFLLWISISGHWKKIEQKIFVTDKRCQMKMDDRNVVIDFVKLGFQVKDFLFSKIVSQFSRFKIWYELSNWNSSNLENLPKNSISFENDEHPDVLLLGNLFAIIILMVIFCV